MTTANRNRFGYSVAMQTAKATLSDVAALAQVSKATASKALNGRAQVSATARERVLQAAMDLGYARGARVGGNTIAFVVDSMTATYTLEVLRGAVTSAMTVGLGLLSYYTPGTDGIDVPVPLQDDWFDQMHQTGCLGVVAVTSVLTAAQLEKAASLNLPVVVIDPANALPSSVVCISATNWNGGVDATRHLIELGHRRIAFIRGPLESMPSNERMQGYLSALAMHGIEADPELVRGDSFLREDAVAVARELLELPEEQRPTAFFTATDVTAIGVIEAALQKGLRVPDDLSVVGFDDTFLAELSTPQLTTVHQPLEQMGAAAVRQIVALAAGQPTLSGTVRLSTRLVVRGSTQALT